MPDANDPSNLSSSSEWMLPRVQKIAAILGGIETMKEAGEAYLPKFSTEEQDDYDFRLRNAFLTNIFFDVVDSLSGKPFTEPVSLEGSPPDAYKMFKDDVTGCRESLHDFLSNIFMSAVADGITWVLVDYTSGIPRDATRAEEMAMGARPRWVHYKQMDVLAAYSEFVNGVERFTEVRLKEVSIERVGFSEKSVERVRIFRHDGPVPTWELWRKVEKTNKKLPATNRNKPEEWEMEIPPQELDIDVIPFVPVIFGKRLGKSWKIEPPLMNAAELQVELYQKENGLKYVRIATAFPMLAANGISPDPGDDGQPKPVKAGPCAILYGSTAEQGQIPGTWQFIEPSSESLKFLLEDIRNTIKELRELGRQPLTAQSGNLTVITTAVAASKANSVIETWVVMLEKAADLMFEYTGKWMNMDTSGFSTKIHKDFDLGFGDDASFTQLIALASGDFPLISRDALLKEAKRRNILEPGYDPDEDLKKIFTEPVAQVNAVGFSVETEDEEDPNEYDKRTAKERN